MITVEQLVTDSIGAWTAAIKPRVSTGKGASTGFDLYGVGKLRGLILDLAVRGLLVPQRESDEPAGKLLQRISQERTRLIEAGELKKPKPLKPIDDADRAFTLPSNWSWARLGDFTNYGQTEKVEPDRAEHDTWVLELEDVEKTSSRLLKKVYFKDRPFKSSKNLFRAGDVIYGKLRPYLDKVLVADTDGVCTTEMIPVRGFCGFDPQFLRLLMKSPSFIAYANSSTHGMNLPRMGTESARSAVVAVAPLAEQPLIAAKVEELMLLCDQLEAQQADSIEAHKRLVTTLLDALTKATEQEGFDGAWARIAEHFDALFTTEWSVDQLKQTILQLAMMGRLVPQDPSHGSADRLLSDISTEKARLVSRGSLKKQAPLQPVNEAECRYPLPAGWKWCRFGEVTSSRLGKMLDKAKNTGKPLPYLRNTNVQWFRFDLDDIKTMKISDVERDEFRLEAGDLLICEGGEPGRCAIWQGACEEMYFQKALHRAKTYAGCRPEYLQICLACDAGSGHLETYFTGATIKHFVGAKLDNYAIPLPPAASQDEIVSAVERLFSICDALKSAIQEAQQTQLLLADAITEQAVA